MNGNTGVIAPLVQAFFTDYLGSSLFHVGRTERSSLPTMR